MPVRIIFISLLLVGFTEKSFAEDVPSLEKLIQNVAVELGLNKNDIGAYFRTNPRKVICRDTIDSTVKVLSYTALVYSGGKDMLYLEHEIGGKPHLCYMLIGQTPHLSFRSRLGRSDFEDKSQGADWLRWEAGGLLIESFMHQPMVGDVLCYVKSCLGGTFSSSRWVVVQFSSLYY